MILVRNVFQAKFGKGGELAQQMAQMTAVTNDTSAGGRWRVLTDLSSGPFDTVVHELEVESLAAWEALRARMFADPRFQDSTSDPSDLIQSGRAELYTIEAQGGS